MIRYKKVLSGALLCPQSCHPICNRTRSRLGIPGEVSASAYEPTPDEAGKSPDFCVLPDWWKFHVLRLNLKKDMSDGDWITTKTISLRSPIWMGFQLHGDVGERLKLVKKHTLMSVVAFILSRLRSIHRSRRYISSFYLILNGNRASDSTLDPAIAN